ncbi:MAG TPA: hypothetical protein VHR42_05035, partial [Clostridia bacterium]|nr:hypothetical protein [Clostridia bacterium]
MKTSNFRYRAAKWLIGLETLMIVLLGIGNIIPVLPFRIGMLSRFSRGYSFFSPEMISFHRSLSTIIGVILIFISYRLYNRVKMAWVIAMCLLPVSLLLRLRPGVGH